MIQEIITIGILTLVAAITIRHYWKRFRRSPANQADPCNGCGSGCEGCPVLDLKEKIEEKKNA